MTTIETLVKQAKAVGVTVCADMDEDCHDVVNPYSCWRYSADDSGFCPFCAHLKVVL